LSVKSREIMSIENLNLKFDSTHVLKDVSLSIEKHRVTAIIGPSGSGKSSLLRCLNRMVDLTPTSKTDGAVYFEGGDILSCDCDEVKLRQNIGMVFQKPNPFPRSIYDNVAYGPRLRGVKDRSQLDEIVQRALKGAALWSEVSNRLEDSALELSGGQQQRLCIARSLAVRPQILLMDEPCSALDPAATTRVEDLISQLRNDITVVLVTHNLQQAARASDYTAFLLGGELVEFGETEDIFTNPQDQRTDDYVTGRFG